LSIFNFKPQKLIKVYVYKLRLWILRDKDISEQNP
jgi:hypothetical protein